jgi:hypothetical protein
LALFALLISVSATLAQTTTPATQPQPYRITPPQGFARVEAGGLVAYCEPVDAEWVRATLVGLPPTTRPSTMPADLATKIEGARNAMWDILARELLYTDKPAFEKFVADQLVPEVRKFDSMKTPIYYLVTSSERLKELMAAGWTDRNYYYNRVADEITFQPGLNLRTDGESDELLLPALYAAAEPAESRRARLAEAVGESQMNLLQSIANRAQFVAQLQLIDFIREQVLAPLRFRADQDWFVTGAAGVVSAEMITAASGRDLQQLVLEMIVEPGNTPYRMTMVNLLRPENIDDLRPEFVPFYLEAVRRKSTAVIWLWLERGGKDSLGKLMAQVRKQRPEGGNALLEAMRQVNNVDVSQWVQ